MATLRMKKRSFGLGRLLIADCALLVPLLFVAAFDLSL
jgi:hypothetical protein